MSTAVTTCRSCGLENAPGRDFCDRCGEYLSWAPTGYVPAVADIDEPAEPLAGEMVTTGADAEPAQAGEDATAVEPGPPEAAAAEKLPTELPPPVTEPDPALVAPPPQSPPPPGPTVPEIAAVAQAPPASGDASLVLTAADPAVGAAGVAAVDAGAMLTFLATIRNESQIVDNYDLAVTGLPEGWAVVSPAAAYLVPLGSGRGESDQALRIDITPPRNWRSTAGIWTFELVALSRTTTTIAARAVAQFEVRPFQAWSVEAVPLVKSGRLRARFRAAARNDGNAEQLLYPIAIEDSGRLRTRFAAGRMTVQPGEVGVDVLTVKPRIPLPVGRTIEHRIGIDVLPTAPQTETELTAKEKLAARAKQEAAKTAKGVKVTSKGVKLPKIRPPRIKNPLKKLKLDAGALARLRSSGDSNAPASARQVSYRQKPIIPLWVIGLLLLLAIAGYVIYTLWPQKTEVPALIGAGDAFVAEKRLREAGLVLSQPTQRRADPDAEPGSVIEQSPSPGAKVDEGDSVTIVVADGETKVPVPRLADLTRVKADERLREVGLSLGETQPADAPDDYVVRSQIPDVGLSVDRGTTVKVFLKKPPPTAKEKAAAAKAKKAKEKAAAGGAGGAGITIPEIDDKTAPEYSKALTKLGLTPKLEPAIGAPAGKVLAVDPAPGEKAKKGDTVTVRAAAGLPPIAVQTARLVLLVDPAGGKEIARLPGGAGRAFEPAAVPGTDQIVYRSSSTRLVLAGTGKNDTPRTLYNGPDVLERPSVAADRTTIAVIRREEGDGDLCFGRIDVSDLGHLCLPDDGWDLNGRISWRQDGEVVLVPARRRDNPAVFGIRRYQAQRAFAPLPESWSGSTATNVATPGKGVLAAAYSPGGTRVAVVSNLQTDRFEVVLADADDLALSEPKATGAPACDVVWRPDGQELSVVVSDDACTKPLGAVVRFSIGAPLKPAPVKDGGTNPTYAAAG